MPQLGETVAEGKITKWFKQAGLGREGAQEGMKEFQETQYVSVIW